MQADTTTEEYNPHQMYSTSGRKAKKACRKTHEHKTAPPEENGTDRTQTSAG